MMCPIGGINWQANPLSWSSRIPQLNGTMICNLNWKMETQNTIGNLQTTVRENLGTNLCHSGRNNGQRKSHNHSCSAIWWFWLHINCTETWPYWQGRHLVVLIEMFFSTNCFIRIRSMKTRNFFIIINWWTVVNKTDYLLHGFRFKLPWIAATLLQYM